MDDVESLARRHAKAPDVLPGGWNLRANVDGPWVFRDPDDFEPAIYEFAAKLRSIQHLARADACAQDLTPLQQFLAGVSPALNWTLGTAECAPLRGPEPLTVSDAAVDELLLDASRLARVTPHLRYYGAGVRGWLLWIVGASDRINYPRQ